MQNTLYTQTPTASPYAITPVPGADWLFELTWQGRPIDTFYSYSDAEDASVTHAALWEAESAASPAVVCDTADLDWDCACGDMHRLPELLGSLEVQMLDSCLGAPHSDGEAGCVLVELESRGIYVEPVECAWCGRTHLVRKAGR